MVLAIQMQALGGPDVLTAVEIDVPPPGPHQVQLRQTVIGVNFIDIYHRTGLYPLPRLPAVIGMEGAGIVEAVGPEVAGIVVGDRVAYAGLPAGGYAECRNLPESRVVRVPDGISDKAVGSTMLRGLTAHMLLHRVYPLQPGAFVLVHAAAGGLGQLLTRWAKRLGRDCHCHCRLESQDCLGRSSGCRSCAAAYSDGLARSCEAFVRRLGCPCRL